jgi:large subunit ribosomal protein L19
MLKKIIDFNQEQRKAKKFPDLKSGDVVSVHLKIKEGEKERIQVFQGLIIAIKGKQSSSPTITVRKVSNGVGVEMILPVYSKNIEKIELVKRAKVRRSKLYYIRELTAKKSRMKYKDVAEFIPEEIEEPKAEEKKEEVEVKEEKE